MSKEGSAKESKESSKESPKESSHSLEPPRRVNPLKNAQKQHLEKLMEDPVYN